jgi:hypothetical protein
MRQNPVAYREDRENTRRMDFAPSLASCRDGFFSMNFLIRLTVFVLLPSALIAQDAGLSSGQAQLQLKQDSGNGGYALTFINGGRILNTYTPGKPLSLEVNGDRLDGGYAKVSKEENGALVCQGLITTQHGSRFLFTDRYLAEQPGAFELRRSIVIRNADPADQFFNSLFGIQVTGNGLLEDSEFFVPGVWYRTNLKTRMAGALAKNPTDHYFFFREDRLPLPLVTLRDPRDGDTVSLIHAAAEPSTITGDRGVERVVDERMRFGSVGVRHLDGTTLAFMFPGSEGEKNHVVRRESEGWALRSHPVKEGIKHDYKLVIRFSKTADYPEAVETTWKHAFQLYQPKLRPVDVNASFTGLIDTLDHYSVGNGYDAPGFPFSVQLPSGEVRSYNYQMGFVGRQLPNAYFLIHQGIVEKRADLRRKGVEIVDFWAGNCLLPSGMILPLRKASPDHGGKTTIPKAARPCASPPPAWKACSPPGGR